MKSIFVIVVLSAMVSLAGCAQFQNTYPQLIESQAPLVENCQRLGVIAETANADHLSVYMARRSMENRVRGRAVQLGATHIVWLHRTETSATAQAFRCPEVKGKD